MIKLYFAEADNSKIESEEFARTALGRYLGSERNEFVIEKNRYGKPCLKNFPDLHFNISHTKGAIVCAVSNNPVGVDIEKIKPFNRSIAEKFFTRKEQEYLFSKDAGMDIRFCEIWTKKEAYVKCLGIGMTLPFDSFDILDDNRIVTVNMNGYVFSCCSD